MGAEDLILRTLGAFAEAAAPQLLESAFQLLLGTRTKRMDEIFPASGHTHLGDAYAARMSHVAGVEKIVMVTNAPKAAYDTFRESLHDPGLLTWELLPPDAQDMWAKIAAAARTA